MVNKVLKDFYRLRMPQLDWKLEANGVEMLGNLRASLTLSQGLVVLLNSFIASDVYWMWVPGINVFGN